MMIYRAAGEPPVETSAQGACRLCGAEDEGQPFRVWVKDTFTDHASLRPGEIVCRGCLILTQNFSTLYQQLLQRDKPQKPWNWSHFVADGEYIVLSKGDKPRMREILARNPEVAVIADSGQKHIAFRAQPYVWQFELLSIRADPAGLARLLDLTDALYSMGANKAQILSGHYATQTLARMDLAEWRRLECQIRPHRGSPLLELAVFLTLKPEEADVTPEPVRTPDPEPVATGGQYALL